MVLLTIKTVSCETHKRISQEMSALLIVNFFTQLIQVGFILLIIFQGTMQLFLQAESVTKNGLCRFVVQSSCRVDQPFSLTGKWCTAWPYMAETHRGIRPGRTSAEGREPVWSKDSLTTGLRAEMGQPHGQRSMAAAIASSHSIAARHGRRRRYLLLPATTSDTPSTATAIPATATQPKVSLNRIQATTAVHGGTR